MEVTHNIRSEIFICFMNQNPIVQSWEGGDRQFGNRDGGNRRGGGGHHRGGDRDQNGPGKFGERIKFSDRGYSNNKFGDNKNNDRKPRTFASNNRE